MFRVTATRQIRAELVARKFKEYSETALYAAAIVIQNAVKRALRGGYKTSLANFAADEMAKEFEAGRTKVPKRISVKVRGHWRPVGGGGWVTGNSINHVAIGPVINSGDGLTISVGTDLKYNLFWEIGHHNIFTRHYERDEKWVPAFRESTQAAKDAYVSALNTQIGEASFETQEER